jgi:hypothetical protein
MLVPGTKVAHEFAVSYQPFSVASEEANILRNKHNQLDTHFAVTLY